MRRFTPLATILLGLSAGCGDQASPGYKGEPLVTLRGVLVSELAQTLPEVDLVLAWPDWPNLNALSPDVRTFHRLPVMASLPAHFSADIFEPPPESAYSPRYFDSVYGVDVGIRATVAAIMLVRKGMEVTTTTSYRGLEAALNDPNEPLVAIFYNVVLAYYESDGWLSWRYPDGTIQDIAGPYTKGFHLYHYDAHFCLNGPIDEACVAQQLALGSNEDGARWNCADASMVTQTVTSWVPVDSELTLVVRAYNPPLPPCTPPPPE